MKTVKAIADPSRTVEILQWENKKTGEITNEWMIPVIIPGSDCHNLYLDESGNFYTKGIIGWMQMNKYIKL